MSIKAEKKVAIFEAVIALESEEQRNDYLDRVCTEDDLRREVDALIRAHQAPDSLIIRSDLAETIPAEPISERPGAKIGRYKLLQQIGEGGMGVVFMAEQTEPVRRNVALKIIKLGMDTKSVVARFEAERQALALMDHPNIAKVLDAGSTETGRPYFVMELVKGVPINEYCDKNRLPTKERLQLFTQVCQAIQHAHQKGVIHRDIKPSNILVTLHDGKPVPKVIDFGIAKATNQRLTEKTLFTNFAQLIGTPAYMSPEQAEMSGLDVDTRTDIYSLGVLLYELLTGTTPFPEKELLSKGYGEMQRVIAEQEPERPSIRMSTLDGAQQTILAKNRSEDSSSLSKRLRGDLDWIVMKSLEKDRTRRYETAAGFADDIRRHIANEPVAAARPSLYYKISKSIKRNRAAFGAGISVAAILTVSSIVSTLSAMKAQQAKEEALALQETAQSLNEFLFEGLIGLSDPTNSSKRSITLFEALEKVEGRISENFADRPELEIHARLNIGRAYALRFSRERADHHLKKAYALSRTVYGDNSPETLEVGKAYLYTWISVEERIASPEFDPAIERLYNASLELYSKEDPRRYVFHAWEALRLARAGKLQEAFALLQETQPLHAEIREIDPASAAFNLGFLARLNMFMGNLDEALRLMRDALDEFIAYVGDSHPLTLLGRKYFSRLLEDKGEYHQAISELEILLENGKDIFLDDQFLTGVSNQLLELYKKNGDPLKEASLTQEVLDQGASEFDVEEFVIRRFYANTHGHTHEEAVKTQAWEKALEDLNAYAAAQPNSAAIRKHIAECYYILGNIEDHYQSLSPSFFPDDQVYVHESRALNRAAAKEWGNAYTEINNALELEPGSVPLQHIAAQIELQLGNLDARNAKLATILDIAKDRGETTILEPILACLTQPNVTPGELRNRAAIIAEEAYLNRKEDESALQSSSRVLLGGLAAINRREFQEAAERMEDWPYRTATPPTIKSRHDWERIQFGCETWRHLLLAQCNLNLGQLEAAEEHFLQSDEFLNRMPYDHWTRFESSRLRASISAALEEN